MRRDAGSPRNRDTSRRSDDLHRARPKSLSACSLRSIKIITQLPSLSYPSSDKTTNERGANGHLAEEFLVISRSGEVRNPNAARPGRLTRIIHERL
jgi:hypothetical protein